MMDLHVRGVEIVRNIVQCHFQLVDRIFWDLSVFILPDLTGKDDPPHRSLDFNLMRIGCKWLVDSVWIPLRFHLFLLLCVCKGCRDCRFHSSSEITLCTQSSSSKIVEKVSVWFELNGLGVSFYSLPPFSLLPIFVSILQIILSRFRLYGFVFFFLSLYHLVITQLLTCDSGVALTRFPSVFLCQAGNHDTTSPVVRAYTRVTRMMEPIPD
jgi:hypothetical protein